MLHSQRPLVDDYDDNGKKGCMYPSMYNCTACIRKTER